MSIHMGMFYATWMFFAYGLLSNASNVHSEGGVQIISEVRSELVEPSDEWNPDAYPCEDWSQKLVDDNIIAIELIKEMQALSKEELDDLCIELTEVRSKETPSEAHPRRTKRGIKSWFLELKTKAKLAILNQVAKYVRQQQNNPSCHNEVGCFYRAERMAVEVGGPAPPAKVGTKITFFKSLSSKGDEVTYSTWVDYIRRHPVNLKKSLFGITHGFTRDSDMSWMHELKNALFEQVDCNVVLVEWISGAKFPNYAAAAANSPMPGVLLSMLLQEMIKEHLGHLSPESVHLIGFSLGAQAAGFCGRHFYSRTGRKLGRITGLDPAGPLFEKTNVSLSSEDADFVDVIHTHAGSLRDYKLGISESIGDVDFYPNGGSSQLGCESILKVGCSHKRAQAYFIESVRSKKCHFKSYYCEGGWSHFEECTHQTNESYIGEMGFHSRERKGRGNQYLKTNNKPPYCIPQSP